MIKELEKEFKKLTPIFNNINNKIELQLPKMLGNLNNIIKGANKH